VDSTYVYGSVGTGRAALEINGTPVPVAPNGAFLAFLPLPADGRWVLVARAGGEPVTAEVAYAAPRPAAPARPDTAQSDTIQADTAAAPATPGAPAAPATPAAPAFTPQTAVVTGGRDTLATGSDVAVGRPTPTGTYRWFLPRGARLRVVERRGDQLRAQLDSATSAWFPANALTLGGAASPAGSSGAPSGPARLAVAPAAEWVDLRFAVGGAPFLVQAAEDRLTLTLYGRTAPTGSPSAADPLLAGIAWRPATPGRAEAEVRLARPLWGYKAFYEADGTLVLRVRRPPALDASAPLRGARIAIDPGHPPAGATGPTGLTEAEANLAIGSRLAERLRAAGAEVLMTRTANVPVELGARTDTATAWNAHLLVSVHNNAFGEGVNPFRNHSTAVYYFQPFSAGLARELDREIVGVTRIPDLGARQSNLALARPTWMPSALTESLFMLIPEQEAALRNPEFLDRLADAHVRGIEAFLRSRAGAAGAPAR
jgi:N-acetylmuramoyl-L-alanine amidase